MDVMDPVAVELDEDDEGPHKRSFHKELWFLLVVALALALLMKTFLIQAFFIPSGSMEKTLHGCGGCQGDRVLVNKLVYDFRDIHRGEVVVFNGRGTNFTPEFDAPPPPANPLKRVAAKLQGWLGFGQPGEKDFIKRVIGIPGDTVACCTDGRVTVNGQALTEPYVFVDGEDTSIDGHGPQDTFDPVLVPDNHLFVMGDHRNQSSDSRYNGTIPQTAVVGRAFSVFWPAGRIKVLGVPYTFDPPGGAAAAPYVLGIGLATPITVVRRRLRRTTD